jgi:hypothetical protein
MQLSYSLATKHAKNASLSRTWDTKAASSLATPWITESTSICNGLIV